MWIEHLEPQGAAETARLTNVYGNLVYTCAGCNNARGNRFPVSGPNGQRLLDPTQVSWADHFERDGDFLKPRQGDANAEYTWHAYDLDDSRKVVRRRKRRNEIASALEQVARAAEHEALYRKAAEVELSRGNHAMSALYFDRASDAAHNRRQWLGVLRGWRAIPDDVDACCLCKASPSAATAISAAWLWVTYPP
jgi:hypothetical protein